MTKMTKLPKMSIKEFAKDLEKRTMKFAIRIIQLSSKLPNTPEGKIIRNQITKAGTSIGANYREANRSRSKADFRSRIKIVESEASECQYWLEIVIEMKWLNPEATEWEHNEVSELLALFTTISKNSL